MRYCILLLILTAFCFTAVAQKPDTIAYKSKKDSARQVRDSIKSKPFVPKATTSKIYHPDSTHSPHKAFLRSAMLPGWGQVYNHRWWKVPILYTGFGLLGAAIVYNQHYYTLYVNEAKRQRNGDPPSAQFAGIPGGYQQFFDAAASNQRNLQLSILGVLGVWGINCIDAYIDAKFIHSYTVDNNLSFRITPTMLNSPAYAANNYGFVPGVKLTFAVK